MVGLWIGVFIIHYRMVKPIINHPWYYHRWVVHGGTHHPEMVGLFLRLPYYIACPKFIQNWSLIGNHHDTPVDISGVPDFQNHIWRFPKSWGYPFFIHNETIFSYWNRWRLGTHYLKNPLRTAVTDCHLSANRWTFPNFAWWNPHKLVKPTCWVSGFDPVDWFPAGGLFI